MKRTLTATFAGAALLLATAGTAHAATPAATSSTSTSIPECWTAECATPWGRPGEWPLGEEDFVYEDPIASWSATGRGPDYYTALERAMNRAQAVCPSGMKLTGTDQEDDGETVTVTVSFTCPVP